MLTIVSTIATPSQKTSLKAGKTKGNSEIEFHVRSKRRLHRVWQAN